MVKTTTTAPVEGMRRCSGSRTFGIEVHEAPIADFPVQPSRKDGLGTMCKPHWREYTNALRKAALGRKAAGIDEAPASIEAAALAVPEGRRRQRRSRTAHAEAYVKAVGSDEVQEALEVAPPIRYATSLVAGPDRLAYLDES